MSINVLLHQKSQFIVYQLTVHGSHGRGPLFTTLQGESWVGMELVSKILQGTGDRVVKKSNVGLS